jgi:sarcosine oxidase
MYEDFDVAVIGLGSVGSMAMWQLCTTTDLKVVGLEQWGVGHAYGSYAGESRVFRAAYHEGWRYVPLLLRSRELWLDLEKTTGRQIFLDGGMLAVDTPGHAPYETTLESIRRYDLPHRHFSTAELRKAYPQHIITDETEAVLDELGGGLRSEVAVLAGVQAAVAAGGTVIDGEPVLDIDESGDMIVIRLATRTIRVAQVVVTAGSWSAQLRPQIADVVSICDIALTWFAPNDPSRYAPGVFPAFLRDQNGVHMFGVPTLDNYSVKVVSHTAVDSQYNRVDDVPATVSRAAIEEISRNATAFFADLSPEPVRHSMHHESITASRVPIVDLDPSGRIVTIAGLSGHGFKFAPALGQLATSLLTGTNDALYSADFGLAEHPDRQAQAVSIARI